MDYRTFPEAAAMFGYSPEAMQTAYHGFIDQDPVRGESPFNDMVEDAYFHGLNGAVEIDPRRHWHGGMAYAAYYAGRDVRTGRVQRGTTDLLQKWVDGATGNIRYPNHVFSKFSIRNCIVSQGILAERYEDHVFYLWGAIAGHAFPKACLSYSLAEMRSVGEGRRTGHAWRRIQPNIKKVRDFARSTAKSRRHNFHDIARVIEHQPFPNEVSPSRAYLAQGMLGLVRVFFRDRWSACLQRELKPKAALPDLPKGFSHVRLRDTSIRSEYDYLLCHMEDAVLLKMATQQQFKIHDLNTPVEGVDV